MASIVPLPKFWRQALKWFIRTSAPLEVYRRFLTSRLIVWQERARLNQFIQKFSVSHLALLDCSADWVDHHLMFWKLLQDSRSRDKKPILNVLEVGSWEGRSAVALLNMFPDCHLTCVDTWLGSDEHQYHADEFVKSGVLSKIEARFDKNTEAYSDRVKKYKGTSGQYFQEHADESNQFDLVYIDGSHYVDDVLKDALAGFRLVKKGGVLIFDDYLWGHYANVLDNAAPAINCFLKLKKGQYRVRFVYEQLILEKL